MICARVPSKHKLIHGRCASKVLRTWFWFCLCANSVLLSQCTAQRVFPDQKCSVPSQCCMRMCSVPLRGELL